MSNPSVGSLRNELAITDLDLYLGLKHSTSTRCRIETIIPWFGSSTQNM